MPTISRRLMVTNGNLTGLTERLVKERLVSRSVSPDDRRSQRVRLTANGRRAFQQMAKLSRGAYLRFDLASADRLKDLLAAVAVYAAGGYRALAAYGEKKGGEVLRLTSQLRG